jgi:uncharacterized protein
MRRSGRAVTPLLLLIALSATACRGGSVDAKQIFPEPKAAALAEAAAAGDRALIRKLVEAGADPNARGDKGVYMVQWALLNKSKAGVDALLEAGADPARADNEGKTVVHYAALANDPAYLDILLAHHADPNTRNAVDSTTPIMSALMGSRDVQFHKLLAAGADPNRADRFGNTALHVAARINAGQRVLELLQAGADPLARNRQGVTFQRYFTMTPASVASEDFLRQRRAVDEWLRRHNVPVEEPSSR